MYQVFDSYSGDVYGTFSTQAEANQFMEKFDCSTIDFEYVEPWEADEYAVDLNRDDDWY